MRMIRLGFLYGLVLVFWAICFFPAEASNLDTFREQLASRLEAGLVLNEQEREFLDKHPVIRMGIDAEFVPYTGFTPDGRPEGMAIDYLQLVEKVTGLRFEVVPGLKWSEILEGARKKDLDLIATATPRPARSEYLNFSQFHIPTPWIVLTRSEDAAMPKTAQDLSGRKAALVLKYGVSEALMAEHPDLIPQWYSSPVEALQALSLGEADIYAGVIGVATHLAHENGFANLKALGPLSVQPDGQRFAVRKDWPLLLSIIDKVLQPMTIQDHMRLKEAWLPGVRAAEAVGPIDKQSLSLTQTEESWLNDNRVIRMCVDPDWMPYEEIDGQGRHVGIAADYMQLFATMLNADIQLVPTRSWSESEVFAKARKCDILSMLNKSARRLRYLDFTEPYVQAPVVLIADAGVPYIDGLKGLVGKKLAVVDGYVYEDLIRDRHKRIQIIPVSSVSDGLAQVSRGAADAMIGSLYVITHQMQELGYTNLKIAGRTEFTNRFRVGVRNDLPVLVSLMRKAVAARDPAKENEILQRWMSVRLETGTDYVLLFQVLGGFAIVAAFFGYRHVITTRHNRELSENNKILERLSREDQLTGIANRMHLDETLEREIRRVRRYGHELSVIMVDIDHFKMVNDKYGHQAGDKVLQQVSSTIRNLVRETDLLGRWGGEEFVIISPSTDQPQAYALAEKLRAALEDSKFDIPETVTASFGVAAWMHNEDGNVLMKRVDAALYQAKRKGRNCVEVV